MVKLLTLFREPPDVDEFEAHFRDVFLPLCREMPGLQGIEVQRVVGQPNLPGAEDSFYLILNLHFRDRDELDASILSPEGREAARDLMSFARGFVAVMYTSTASG